MRFVFVFLLLSTLPIPAVADHKTEFAERVLASYHQSGDLREKFQAIRPFLSSELESLWGWAVTRRPKQGFWLEFDPLGRHLKEEQKQNLAVRPKDFNTVNVQYYFREIAQPFCDLRLKNSGGLKVDNVIYRDGLDLKRYLKAQRKLAERKSIMVR